MQIRNLLFSIGVLKVIKPSVSSISLGNLTMGGTGKTPFIKYLIQEMDAANTVVISRGYGRESRGFRVVELKDAPSLSGDEPLEIKNAFPEIKMVVCENRKLALQKLEKENCDLYLFDDLFQHQYVKAHCTILLSTYDAPFYTDFVLPSGNLREFACNKSRADVLVVTKCPTNLTSEEANIIKEKLKFNGAIFFSTIAYKKIDWLGQRKEKVLLLTGIANTKQLIKKIEEDYNLVKIYSFRDHYAFKKEELKSINTFAKANDANVITTAKDYVKLKDFNFDSSVSLGVLESEVKILFNQKGELNSLIKINIHK